MDATVLGWDVENIYSPVADLVGRGVEFERFDQPHLEQDPEDVWESPGGARVAWFKDSDGNLLSLTQGPG